MPFITKDPDAVHFDHSLDSSSEDLLELVEYLYKETKLSRQKHKDALKLILLNLIASNGEKVLINRDNNHKIDERYNALCVGVTALKTAVDSLFTAKYIHFIEGKKLPYRAGFKSSIEATSLLRMKLQSVKPELQPSDLVVFRAGENNRTSKDLVDYIDTPRTKRIRQELKDYNALLAKTDIGVRDQSGSTVLKDLNNQIVQRKFIDNGEIDTHGRPLFNSGGRSHAAWFNLSSTQERPFIYIDGQPTTEVDYQASSVNVIYRVLTNNVYHGDPYDVSIKERQIPREVVKSISTIALNNDNQKSMSSAVGSKYREIGKSKTVSNQSKHSDYRSALGVATITEILEAFLIKHSDIRHCFLKGKHIGNKVQCLESDLVFEIVNQLTKQNIPCLTVHDSFIVKQEHLDLLSHLMDTTTFPDQDLVESFLVACSS